MATKFHYRLNELPLFCGSRRVGAPENMAGFVAAAEAAPDELSTIANVITAPPTPFLPEDKSAAWYPGDYRVLGRRRGRRAACALRPLRSRCRLRGGRAVLGPVPGRGGRSGYHPSAVAVNLYVGRVDRDVAATILDFLERSDASMRVAHCGCWVGRWRVCRRMLPRTRIGPAGSWSIFAASTKGRRQGREESRVRDFAAAIDQGDRAVYANFLADEVRSASGTPYPGSTWDRPVEIKRRYDPTNLFRLNQNITP